MAKFKEGDKVICNDAHDQPALQVGKTYTVTRLLGSEYITVAEAMGGDYYAHRFARVPEEIKVEEPKVEVKEAVFDFNAPIEHQITRNGKKVLWIADTKLDIIYPIMAVLEGDSGPTSFTAEGKYSALDDTTEDDLVTIVPEKVSTMFLEIGPRGELLGSSYGDFKDAYEDKYNTTTALLEVTVKPSTLESTSKIVWKKGGTVL